MTHSEDTTVESNVNLNNQAVAPAQKICEPGKKMDSKRKACKVDDAIINF